MITIDLEKEPKSIAEVPEEDAEKANEKAYQEYKKSVENLEKSKVELKEAKEYRSELRRDLGFQVLRFLGTNGFEEDSERATDNVLDAKDRIKEDRDSIVEAKTIGSDINEKLGDQLQSAAKIEMESEIAKRAAK